MIRSFKLLIVSLVVLGFSVAILMANGSERASSVADELVEAATVLPENEGKLVMVSGTPELADGGVIIDDETGLQVANALYYSRVPYQKVYVERQREVVVDEGEDKLSEADDVTEIEYYVAKAWIGANHDREAVITSHFQKYENPPKLQLSAQYESGDLRLGGFRIDASDVSEYLQTRNRGFTTAELEQACASYIVRSEIDLHAVADEDGDGMLSSGDEVGDVHVLFSYTTLEGAEPVTLIGRQRGDRLVFEEDDLVTESEHVQPGEGSKEAFVDSITAEDANSRRIGIVGLVLGAILLLVSLDVPLPWFD